MSSWAEVDEWAAGRSRDYWSDVDRGGREWRAFAVTSDKFWRFRGRPQDTRIKCERRCWFVPGRWRAAGFVQIAVFVESAEAICRAGKAGKVGPLRPLTRETLEAVLVARDEWLEGGALRMAKPKVVVAAVRPASG